MRTLPPRVVYRWAMRGLFWSGGVTFALLIAWAWPDSGLPNSRITVVAYLTMLSVALGCAIVTAVAAVQVTIHEAFAAGYRTARHVVDDAPATPELRVVE